jgi:hypothetical protein
MSILSNLFGEDNESSNDFLGFLSSTGDFGLNTTNYSYDNEDGEIDESYDARSIDGDFDLQNILGSMSNSESDSDGGGLLGLF